jgi:hypothetical protein
VLRHEKENLLKGRKKPLAVRPKTTLLTVLFKTNRVPSHWQVTPSTSLALVRVRGWKYIVVRVENR